MNRMTSRLAPLASAFTVLACAGAPPAAVAAPVISSSYATPPYTLAKSCDLAKPLVFINLVVRNDGDATAFAMPVETNDSAGGFTGRTILPRLGPGDEIAVQVPLLHPAASPGTVGGVHTVAVVIGTRVMRPLLQVSVPATLCAAAGAAPAPVPTPKPAPTPATAPGTSVVGSRTKRATPQPAVSNVGPNTPALIAASLRPATPSNLHNIGDHGAECLPHVGALGTLVCPDMIRSGDLLLVWDWRPGNGPDDVDGFRVYRVDSGRKELAYTRTDKKDLTLADLPKPPGGYAGRCYAVSAFTGNRESDLSPSFCASGGSVTKTTQLSADHTRSIARSKNAAGLFFFVHRDEYPDAGTSVGFSYAAEQHLSGDTYNNSYTRAGIHFDISSVLNRRLVSAKLILTITKSTGEGNNHSCATHLGTGTEFWWQNNDLLQASFDSPNHADAADIPLADSGPQISVDVTGAVGSWMRGFPNYGFVLRNNNENLSTFTNATCMTTYANPVLVITYY